MTKYLILVKHSVPEIESDHPANTWKLSETGRLRAQLLAEQLKELQPEVIVSSEEPKAKKTAQIIADVLQLKVESIHELHEHDRSNVPFLSVERLQALVSEFFQKPDELVFGNETANQAHARFYRAVHSVLNTYKDKTVVIVTHGTVISLFLSRLMGVDGMSLWNELGLPSFIAMDLHSSTVIVRNNIV